MNSLNTALMWHSSGIACIPILAGSKRPACPWKRWQTEMPSIARLKAWFNSGKYGLAVITGWHGLVVVDWDDEVAMWNWLMSLCPLSRLFPVNTYRVRTRNGFHFYLFVNEQPRNWHGDGVEIKSSGACVNHPPSIHPSGHKYEAVGVPSDIRRIRNVEELRLPQYQRPPPAMPVVDDYDRAWRSVGEGSEYAQAALAGELDRLAQARQGERNNVLCRGAFSLGQLLADLARAAVERALLAGAFAIGLPEHEARLTMVSGVVAGEANPR